MSTNTLISSIRQYRTYLTPLYQLIYDFVTILRNRFFAIIMLSLLGSFSTAGGYLMLMPLTRYFTQSSDTLTVLGRSLPIGSASLTLLVGLIVLLVFAGIQINYQFYLHTLEVMRVATVEAAARAIAAVQDKFPERVTPKCIRKITNNLAFSCGHVLRQFASGLSHLITLPVFLIILGILNPFLTLILFLLLTASTVMALLSMNKVTQSVYHRKQIAQEAKKEQNSFFSFWEEGSKNLASNVLRNKVYEFYAQGAMRELMQNRLGIRREKRKGPLFAEYLWPVVLILLPALVLATGDIREQAPQLVAYLFLLRSFLGLFKGLISTVVGMGKFYPGITCYQAIIRGEYFPECLSFGQEDDREEDEDD